MMRKIAILALLLNTVLFATYFPVAKGALAYLDAYVFMALVGLLTVPVALALIGSERVAGQPWLNRQTLRAGLTLGVLSNLALLVSLQALRYTTATNTAFLGALDGLIGAVIAAAILRERQHGLTWVAGAVSLTGAVIMILGGSRTQAGLGDLLALFGGVIYTWNVFQTDRETRRPEVRTRGVLGVMLLTEAALSLVQSLTLGDWRPTLSAGLGAHLPVLVYVAVVTTVLPYAVTVGLQRFVPPVTVSFIYILEPVWGAGFASLWLGERLNATGLLAAGLILLGSVLALLASRLPVVQPALAYGQAGDKEPTSRPVPVARGRQAIPASLSPPAKGLELGSHDGRRRAFHGAKPHGTLRRLPGIAMKHITLFVQAFGRSVDHIVQAYLASLLGSTR